VLRHLTTPCVHVGGGRHPIKHPLESYTHAGEGPASTRIGRGIQRSPRIHTGGACLRDLDTHTSHDIRVGGGEASHQTHPPILTQGRGRQAMGIGPGIQRAPRAHTGEGSARGSLTHIPPTSTQDGGRQARTVQSKNLNG
jgi:hypothetical protein